MSKLFEKIIYTGLEHRVESGRLIPKNQFGFRRERSSFDCVVTLVTDVGQGFAQVLKTIVVSIDIKGVFNGVQPAVLNRNLKTVGIHQLIINFITFFRALRRIFFSSDGAGMSKCGHVRRLLNLLLQIWK